MLTQIRCLWCAKACLSFLLLNCLLRAQDADTVVLKNDNQKFTILSQIEDKQEVAAFLKILTGPRYENARRFLRDYPQSWLLAQAYDALARGAIELGKYDEAIAAGRYSLRLLPENPSLLVLLANLQTHDAVADATSALEYLDEIERPPNMTQKAWDTLRPQLKASAYFARARARTSQPTVALADLDRAAAGIRTMRKCFICGRFSTADAEKGRRACRFGVCLEDIAVVA